LKGKRDRNGAERAILSKPCGDPYKTFNVQRHLISRRTLGAFRAEAMVQWHAATAAA
jgi:hypothetical protein